MHREVTVTLGHNAEFRFDLEHAEPMGNEEARRWLDDEFIRLECEPLRASGKVLLADKVLVVAASAGNASLADAEWSKQFARAAKAAPLPPHCSFGLQPPQHPGDWGLETVNGLAWLVRALEEEDHGQPRSRRAPQQELHIQRLMPADALRIRGRHNSSNALAALALALAGGASLASMLYGLREYRGEPHRVESIGMVDEVEYFDDSKGTNVGATVAALGGVVAPPLHGADGRERRHVGGPAFVIDRHHGEVAGDDVAEGAFADAFGFHAHAYFHRSGSGEVDRRPERHQLAHVHRGAKRHLVHRHGDHVAPGIARRAHIGHLVEQPQNGPAVHMPRKIGHVRRHQYGEGGGFAGNVFGHGVSRVPPGRWMCACFLGLPR